MTAATHARHDHSGVFDPATATCTAHLVGTTPTLTASSYPQPLPAGVAFDCVVCPLPYAVLVGQPAISWGSERPYVYGGKPDHEGMGSIEIGVGRRMATVIRTDPARVAPADTPVPAKDPRVTVVKVAKERVPSYYRATKAGKWRLTLPGVERDDYFDTKKEATAAGLRRLAILDYQATRTSVAV